MMTYLLLPQTALLSHFLMFAKKLEEGLANFNPEVYSEKMALGAPSCL